MTEASMLFFSSRPYLWLTIVISSIMVSLSASIPVWTGAVIGCVLSFLASSGFLFNDAIDWKIDAVNGMGRLSVANPATRFIACVVAAFLAGIALATSFFTLGLQGFYLTLMILVGSALYSFPLRQLPFVATLLSTWLCTSPIWFPLCLAAGLSKDQVTLVVVAMLSVFAREVILDVRDADGDRAYGRRTIPLLLGKPAALGIAVALLHFILPVIGIQLLQGSMGSLSFWFRTAALLGVAAFFCFPALVLCFRLTPRTVERFIWLSRMGLLFNAVALAIASITSGISS